MFKPSEDAALLKPSEEELNSAQQKGAEAPKIRSGRARQTEQTEAMLAAEQTEATPATEQTEAMPAAEQTEATPATERTEATLAALQRAWTRCESQTVNSIAV